MDESHPIQPLDFNGIHKYAATAYHQVLTAAGKLDAVVLCLTNVYGPRMALNLPAQGFLGGFLRKAMLGEPITVFGDGRQSRDPVYVDDVVARFPARGRGNRNHRTGCGMWAAARHCRSRLSLIAVSAAADSPAPIFRPFPPELKSIDIGSYHSDSTRIRNDLGWSPSVDFNRGDPPHRSVLSRRSWHITFMPQITNPTPPAPVGAPPNRNPWPSDSGPPFRRRGSFQSGGIRQHRAATKRVSGGIAACARFT